MLEVRVLGGLAADLDGRPVQLPADARAHELLAWLVVAPGPHARSALAGRLRPDVGEESARKTLRDAVYELRRALGPAGRDAIVATRDQVGLDPARVRADLWEFRRHAAAGELAAAVDGRMGELLAGMDADWVLRARDEHAAELARVLAALAAQAEAAGELGAAAGWARRRLEAEPLGEEAHRELIRLLASAGDRPAALTAATALADRLRRELGVPPSAETRALVEDVRRGRVGAGAVEPARPPSLPPALARTVAPEGRRPSLDRLQNAWNDALGGHARVAVVGGEPGIGKTTLAGELARRVHAAGATVLYGRCDEQALVPYQPWVEALEALLGELPADEADDWLTAHDGALARLLPARGDGAAPEHGASARYLAFESVRGLLEHAAAARPVLLVLEDLHWADADSAALLRHLGKSLVRGRLLLLVTTWEHELAAATADALAELRRAGPLLHEVLTGLDDDAVAALLARRSVDVGASSRYRERTGGNPFFLEELLLRRAGAPRRARGAARRRPRGGRPPARAPDRDRARGAGPRGHHRPALRPPGARRGRRLALGRPARRARRGHRGGADRRRRERSLRLRPRGGGRVDHVRAARLASREAAPPARRRAGGLGRRESGRRGVPPPGGRAVRSRRARRPLVAGRCR